MMQALGGKMSWPRPSFHTASVAPIPNPAVKPRTIHVPNSRVCSACEEKKSMKANLFCSYSQPVEFKVVALRECPVKQGSLARCEKPHEAVEYWHAHVETSALFNPECECLVVLI